MGLEQLAGRLSQRTGVNVSVREPLSRHTSFRIGGPADLFAEPATADQVEALLDAARELDVPVTVLGRGTNLLVRDGGVRGLVARLGQEFAAIRVEPPAIIAQSGARLRDVCEAAAEASLEGLDFAIGIPGTIGGAVIMNAGAYEGSIADVIESVSAIRLDGERRSFAGTECAFGYRSSVFKGSDWIILEVAMSLRPGDGERILARHREICDRRQVTQPLNLPSAGSIFKRPPGDYAGRLIEASGLKGLRLGGAQVSEKHANFVVNTGNATAANVLALIDLVRERVHEAQDIWLEPEVLVVGEDAEPTGTEEPSP